jgi:hypothetical protein
MCYPAITTFYQCMEWLNGPSSDLETNDCAFTGPGPNEMTQFPRTFQRSGRVMLLFRDLPHNRDERRVEDKKHYSVNAQVNPVQTVKAANTRAGETRGHH